MRFITDYGRLDHKLAINLYQLTRIGKTIQKLEVFQYAAVLDLNMGYYTIRLSPASQDMTAVITEFGKLRYNHLPMIVCASGDVFQAKLYELPGDIEGVKTYTDAILVLSEESFSKHIEQLSIIFVIARCRLKSQCS